MEFLNYHHLLYFWSVAKHGGIARASEELGVAPPTISTQIKSLEAAMGEELFHRRGRQLVLTEAGHTAFGYAEEIFSLGREMVSAMQRRPTDQPLRLAVGVAESVPKLMVHELLTPVLQRQQKLHLTCQEGKLGPLMADLATYRLDVVISDEPAPSEIKVKAFNHLLGECGIAILAAPTLASTLREDFPASLDNAPALLPASRTPLRRQLDRFFDQTGIRPRVVAEFDDTALLKVFGSDGLGFFAVPDRIVEATQPTYGVAEVGRLPRVTERFYAISAERKIKHPAVASLTDSARQAFAQETIEA